MRVSVSIFRFWKGGDTWITPNIIPTHLLTWNTILTHRPVIARNSKYSFNFTGGGSDHRDYTASLQSIPDLSVGFWEFPEACIMIISQPQKSSNKLAPLHHSRPTVLIQYSSDSLYVVVFLGSSMIVAAMHQHDDATKFWHSSVLWETWKSKSQR